MAQREYNATFTMVPEAKVEKPDPRKPRELRQEKDTLSKYLALFNLMQQLAEHVTQHRTLSSAHWRQLHEILHASIASDALPPPESHSTRMGHLILQIAQHDVQQQQQQPETTPAAHLGEDLKKELRNVLRAAKSFGLFNAHISNFLVDWIVDSKSTSSSSFSSSSSSSTSSTPEQLCKDARAAEAFSMEAILGDDIKIEREQEEVKEVDVLVKPTAALEGVKDDRYNFNAQINIRFQLSSRYPLEPPSIFISHLSSSESEKESRSTRGLTRSEVVLIEKVLTEKARILSHRNRLEALENGDGVQIVSDLTSWLKEYLEDMRDEALKAKEAQTLQLNSAQAPAKPVSVVVPSLPFMPPPDVLHGPPQPQTKNLQSRMQPMSVTELERIVREHIDSKIDKDRFEIVHVQNVMNWTQFRKFEKKLLEFNNLDSSKEPIMAPTIGFHCTWNRSNVKSIEENSIIGPGEVTHDGRMIQDQQFAFWGTGIYTSPSFRKASDYSFRDSLGYRQMFVSLVLLGHTRHLVPTDFKNWLFGILNKPIPEGYNSQISADLKEYVVPDSEQLLPVLLVTYGAHQYNRAGVRAKTQFEKSEQQRKIDYDDEVIKKDVLGEKEKKEKEEKLKKKEEKRQLRLQRKEQEANRKESDSETGAAATTSSSTSTASISSAANEEETQQEGYDINKKQQKKSTKIRREDNRHIFFDRVPGTKDKWVASFNRQLLDNLGLATASKKTEVRLYYLLDKSQSMGKSFRHLVLPACSFLQRKVNPDRADAIFFGRTVTRSKVESYRFFESDAVKATPLEDATNIIGGYSQALESALAENEEFMRGFEDESFEKSEKYLAEVGALRERAQKEVRRIRKRIDPTSEEAKLTDEELQNKRFEELRSIYRYQSRNRPQDEVLFIFILMSDGVDTLNTKAKTEETFIKYSKMIQGSGMNCIFKVVGIGRESSTEIGMKAKLATQTLSFWEPQPISYCQTVQELPAVMANLGQEIRNVLDRASLKLKVWCPIWNGFITRVSGLPSDVAKARVSEDGRACFLYKGLPPRDICVGYSNFKVYLSEQFASTTDLLELLRQFVMDIKVAAVAQRDVNGPLKQVKEMVKGIKGENFKLRELASLTAEARVKLMKKKRGLVVELEEMMNRLEVELKLASTNMNSEQQASWLNKITDMKFGAKALKRATTAEANAIYNELRELQRKMSGDNNVLEKMIELPTDFKSKLSFLTASVHLKEMIRLGNNPSLSVVEYLYFAGMVGIGIQVIRSESSNINPWNIQVSRVSNDRLDTASAMCALHAGVKHKDTETMETLQDVLVVLDPRNPEPYRIFLGTPLYRAYLSVVFTRNPDLQLPAQQTALLFVTFVRAVEQLLDKTSKRDRLKSIESVFHIMYTISKRVKASESSYWMEVVKKLFASTPGRFMTEAEDDDIVSVTKILAVICCFKQAAPLFEPDREQQLAEVALAVMAESVSRGVRVLVKSNPKKGFREWIREALKIHPNEIQLPDNILKIMHTSVEQSGAYDTATAKKHSSRFFTKTWSNASPQAVTACLGFARLYHSFCNENMMLASAGGTLESILLNPDRASKLFSYIETGMQQVTMRSFIQQYVPRCDPTQLQIALYVQGLRYHSSKARKDGLPSLLEPEPVIENLAKEERRKVFLDKLGELLKEMKAKGAEQQRALAILQKKQIQTEFLAVHSGLPRIFTHGEVAEMNLTRPKDDQLELVGNTGLLKHHCAYLECPLYLKNLATPKDKLLNRREGLFQHFKYAFVPERVYIRSFHLLGVTLMARHPHLSLQDFIQHLLKELPSDPKKLVSNRAQQIQEKGEILYRQCQELNSKRK